MKASNRTSKKTKGSINNLRLAKNTNAMGRSLTLLSILPAISLEAGVVLTSPNLNLGTGPHLLDVNGDGIDDILLQVNTFAVIASNPDSDPDHLLIAGSCGISQYAARHNPGELLNALDFGSCTSAYLTYSSSGPWTSGPGFLGIRFKIGSDFHFGFLELSLTQSARADGVTVSTIAYEDTPNTGILTASFLPIQLASFEAKSANEGIGLTWSTASEHAHSHFEVQRSVDANSFETIGTLNGRGDSEEVQSYLFTDQSARRGTKYFYRLKNVALDGSFTYSHILTETRAPSELQVVFTPNPRPNILKITSPSAGPLYLHLYDAFGKEILQKSSALVPGSNSIPLDWHALASGHYFAQLQFQDETLYRKVVIP